MSNNSEHWSIPLEVTIFHRIQNVMQNSQVFHALQQLCNDNNNLTAHKLFRHSISYRAPMSVFLISKRTIKTKNHRSIESSIWQAFGISVITFQR